MPIASIKDVEIDSLVTFRSKNATDLVHWRGKLDMVGNYRAIKGYTVPNAYNEGVRQVDPTVPSDVTELTYFLITVDNGATESTTMVFADEWIADGSLVIVNLGTKVKLVVDDPLNNPTQIVSILANAGYAVKIV